MTRGFPNAHLVLLGICWDAHSSFQAGAAEAPDAIRRVLHNGSSNLTSELGIDLDHHPRMRDIGNLAFDHAPEAFSAIETRITDLLDAACRPLVLGGDHAITVPVVRAMADRYGTLDILHFDAHPDLYDVLDGDRFSHASPFARIVEAGLVRRLVQVGIRTLNAHQREQAQRYGVEMHTMSAMGPMWALPKFDGPVYLSFDMDVLDPAHAPGVSHLEPGGLSVREVIAMIHQLNGDLVGADIVEYNPACDINGMTAMVGAKLIKEIGGKMIHQMEAASMSDH